MVGATVVSSMTLGLGALKKRTRKIEKMNWGTLPIMEVSKIILEIPCKFHEIGHIRMERSYQTCLSLVVSEFEKA